MSYWKKQAEALKAEGITPGNGWEHKFETAIRAAKPELVKEFGAEFPYFVRVKAGEAIKHYNQLTENGTDPETARELALHDLLDLG